MKAENISDVQAPKIGSYYQVPCIRGIRSNLWWWQNAWLPIMGPVHEDKEFINFPDDHWHLDWRFFPLKSYTLVTNYRNAQVPNPPHGIVVSQKNTLGPIKIRVMKCLRVMPEFPHKIAPWKHSLETAYSGCKLKCDMICPHRGLPLQGLPVVDGVVTCPGHGLRWNVETRELHAP